MLILLLLCKKLLLHLFLLKKKEKEKSVAFMPQHNDYEKKNGLVGSGVRRGGVSVYKERGARKSKKRASPSCLHVRKALLPGGDLPLGRLLAALFIEQPSCEKEHTMSEGPILAKGFAHF